MPILRQKSFWWWQCSDRYIIFPLPLPPYPPPPPPTPLSVSPFLISLMVSVDVKHHVYLHISSRLAYLHWLPIGSRIQYKLASLCYNCLNSTAPVYMTELLTVHKPNPPASDTSIFCLPSVRLHSSACTLLPALFCLHSSACTLLPALFCLHSSAYTLLPALFCLHSSACTLLPALFCLHSSACTRSVTDFSACTLLPALAPSQTLSCYTVCLERCPLQSWIIKHTHTF